ncbi:MAG: hypothetical protein IJ347_03625 [Faecalibacterium sp.]|nr:hypothetical protein [Faecalibacterium sp.]
MPKKKPRTFTGRSLSFRLQMEWHMLQKRNGTFLLYLLLRLIIVGLAIWSALRGDFESVLLCLLSLWLFLMPSFLERKLKMELPSTLEKIILLFIFAAEILGEIGAYYVRYAWWDTMLHTLNGFLCAAVGFALVDILNESDKVKFQLNPFFMAVVAFCFSMTIGVLWEFFEFGMDWFFQFDMQKDTVVHTISSVLLDPAGGNARGQITDITEVLVNGHPLGLGGYLDIGLIDTMKDLLVNFVGAVVFSIIGFCFIKSRGKGRFARRFIPVRADNDTQIVAVVQPEAAPPAPEDGE